MNVSRAVVRQFATGRISRAGQVDAGYLKIKDVQQKFQKPDGKPVHLKGGAMDQVLYRLTMGLALVGLGGVVHLFWDLSVPKSES